MKKRFEGAALAGAAGAVLTVTAHNGSDPRGKDEVRLGSFTTNVFSTRADQCPLLLQ
jgi:hypothetical protein